MLALADITTCAANRRKDGPQRTPEYFRISFAEKNVEHWQHLHHLTACQMRPPQTHRLWNALGGNTDDDDLESAAVTFSLSLSLWW